MSSSMISLSGWRPRRVTSASSAKRSPACGTGAHDEHGVVRGQLGDRDDDVVLRAGRVLQRIDGGQGDRAVAAARSSGEPQLEQKLLSGGLRWPQWLQKT